MEVEMHDHGNRRSLFVGHGAPTLALSAHPASGFLRALGHQLARPASVIVVSPHSASDRFDIKAPPRFETWHDFHGFPAALYRLTYNPPGDAALAERVQHALSAAGLATAHSADARLDHGAWVPMMLMWPQADVPAVQITIRGDGGPAAHWALGEALRPLLSDGTLLLGSGSVVHNLHDMDPDEAAPSARWALQFSQWIHQRLLEDDRAALLDYRQRAPHAVRAHPHEDHLLPLFVAAGAGTAAARRLFDGTTYCSIGMDAYAF